jgi:hypothetical protein
MQLLLIFLCILFSLGLGISIGIRWAERRHRTKMVPCRNYMAPFYCPIGNENCPDEPCLVAATLANLERVLYKFHTMQG